MIKKVISILTAGLILCFGLTACDDSSHIKKQSELTIKSDVYDTLELNETLSDELYDFYVEASKYYTQYTEDHDSRTFILGIKSLTFITSFEKHYSDLIDTYTTDGNDSKVTAIDDCLQDYYSTQRDYLYAMYLVEGYETQYGDKWTSGAIQYANDAADDLVKSVDLIFDYFYGQKLLSDNTKD